MTCDKCGKEFDKFFEHEKVCVPQENPLKTLHTQINDHIKTHGKIEPIIGAYGNNPSMAYVERKIKTDKGLLTKLYGCSYLYPVQVEYVDEVAITKAVYMGTLKLALQNPFILLRPKKLVLFLSRVYQVDLVKKVSYQLSEQRRRIKYDELRPLPRAIVDVGHKIAETYPLKHPKQKDEFGEVIESTEFRQDIINVFEALASFIQRDGGYYFITLDFFHNIDKGMGKAFELVMQRDRTTLKEKIWIVKTFFFLARFSPLRKVIKEFEKIRIEPDENDTYFAYRKELYDFDGLSREARAGLIKTIDQTKGHIIP